MGAIWAHKKVRWASYIALFVLGQVWMQWLGSHSEADAVLGMFTGFGAVSLWGAGLLTLEKLKGPKFWIADRRLPAPDLSTRRSKLKLAALLLVPMLAWLGLLLVGLGSASVLSPLVFVAEAVVLAGAGLALMWLFVERDRWQLAQEQDRALSELLGGKH